MFQKIFALCAVLLLLPLSAFSEDECRIPLSTGQGLISGFAESEYPSCSYRGIPYARPPVGDLRLARPRPPLAHDGVFAAIEFGPACPQAESILSGGESAEYAEDCLYLNVWRPVEPGSYPVMVWIHGGGFTGGSGGFDIYNGAHLANREKVVVVTINYRLGALGYLALPELRKEDEKGSTGNYGIQDQVRALEWVEDNIAAFSGDPDNVTVFGQSAGGMSVCALLVSPEAEGLFDRAMIMSAPCRLIASMEDAYEKSRRLAQAAGCAGEDAAACLRSLPVESFNIKSENDLFSGGVAWSPTVDGSFLPDMPVTMIERGEYQKMPVIFGTTRDELRIYTIAVSGLGLWSKFTVNWLMEGLTGPNFPEIMAMYDYDDYRRPIDLAFAFGNQMVFDTPMFMMAEAMSALNPVYVYRFDWNETRFPNKMGAFHAVDVPFVFGALGIDADIAKLLASKKTYEDNAYLGYIMMDYVTNFAATGDPNGEGLPAWPRYLKESRSRLYVDAEIVARPLADEEIRRYRWYSERTLDEVLAGRFAKALSGEK